MKEVDLLFLTRGPDLHFVEDCLYLIIITTEAV